ncbi:hypothetical protein HPB51_022104 [Rhipicephalus microplus]|uniref:VWFA domain-containing protein n=1 Tax=Rhipicephalus microplus TaxID=6941 RepID=A0A9J6EC96_RHIMP|nr:hypothetical protein HPB51_022104 [Rhipicephalus microplus]
MTPDTQTDEKVVEGGVQKGDVLSVAGSKATADGPAKPGNLELAHPATSENPKATAFTSLPGSSEHPASSSSDTAAPRASANKGKRGTQSLNALIALLDVRAEKPSCKEEKAGLDLWRIVKVLLVLFVMIVVLGFIVFCEPAEMRSARGFVPRKAARNTSVASKMTDMHLTWLYKHPTTLEAGVARLPVGMKVDAMFKSCMTPGKSQAIHGSKCYYLASCVLNSTDETPQGSMILLMSDDEENRKPKLYDVLPELTAAKVGVSTMAMGASADHQIEKLATMTGGKAFYFPALQRNTAILMKIAFEDSTNEGADNAYVRGQPTISRWKDWEVLLSSVYPALQLAAVTRATDVIANCVYELASYMCTSASCFRCNAANQMNCFCGTLSDFAKPVHSTTGLIANFAETFTSKLEKKFILDPSLGNNTVVIFDQLNPSLADVSVTLINPSGLECTMCLEQGDKKTKRIIIPSPAQDGEWTIRLESPSLQEVEVNIQLKSQAKDLNDKPIRVTTLLDTLQVAKPHEAIIYAEVTKEYKIVLDATAVAEVIGPNSPNKTVVPLHEDGDGEI